MLSGPQQLSSQEIQLGEAEAVEGTQFADARFLEPNVVVRIQIVDTGDFVAALEQAFRDVHADKAGATGHQDRHARGTGMREVGRKLLGGLG